MQPAQRWAVARDVCALRASGLSSYAALAPLALRVLAGTARSVCVCVAWKRRSKKRRSKKRSHSVDHYGKLSVGSLCARSSHGFVMGRFTAVSTGSRSCAGSTLWASQHRDVHTEVRMLKSVRVPPHFEPPFARAETFVQRLFDDFRRQPEQGMLHVGGDRYVLMRAES